METKNIKENLVKTVKGIKRNIIKISTGIGFILVTGRPVYAMTPLQINGMSDVAESLKNLVGAVALFFIGAGALGAMFGVYQLIQSFRSQDGEAKHKGMIEAGIGLGSIVVGLAAGTFKAYIQVQ